MTYLAYAAFAALGLAVLAFVGVLLFLAVSAAFRMLRRPPPPSQSMQLNPEDRNLDFLRRLYPDPAVAKAQMPDLEDLTVNFIERREREEKRVGARRKLDEQYGVRTASSPNS